MGFTLGSEIETEISDILKLNTIFIKVPWYICIDVPLNLTTQQLQCQIPPTLHTYQFCTQNLNMKRF